MKTKLVGLVANLLLVTSLLADSRAEGFTLDVVKPETIGVPVTPVAAVKVTPSKVQAMVPVSVAPTQQSSTSPAAYVYEQKPTVPSGRPVPPVEYWPGGTAAGWYVPPEQLAAQQQQVVPPQVAQGFQPAAVQVPQGAVGTYRPMFSSRHGVGGYYPYRSDGLVPPIRYNSWGWSAGIQGSSSSFRGGSGGAYFNQYDRSGTYYGGHNSGRRSGGSSGGQVSTYSGSFNSRRSGTGSNPGKVNTYKQTFNSR